MKYGAGQQYARAVGNRKKQLGEKSSTASLGAFLVCAGEREDNRPGFLQEELFAEEHAGEIRCQK